MVEGGEGIDDAAYFSSLLDQIDRETTSQWWIVQASMTPQYVQQQQQQVMTQGWQQHQQPPIQGMQHQQQPPAQGRQTRRRGTKRSAPSTSTVMAPTQEHLNWIRHVFTIVMYK